MAKPPKDVSLPKTKPAERLPWPQSPKDISERPRVFRIHRINAYEWQAYLMDSDGEHAIGKPDLFDIVKNKVAGVMRAEGQQEFLAAKNKPDAK